MKEKLLALLEKVRGEGAPAIYVEQRYRLGKCKVPAGEICEELVLDEDVDDMLDADVDVETVDELDALDADEDTDDEVEEELDVQEVDVVECKMHAIIPIFDVVVAVVSFFALCKLFFCGKKKK